MFTVIEDAFGEWRERGRLEDFAALVWGRPGHQPWNLRVVTGPGRAAGSAWPSTSRTGVSPPKVPVTKASSAACRSSSSKSPRVIGIPSSRQSRITFRKTRAARPDEGRA